MRTPERTRGGMGVAAGVVGLVCLCGVACFGGWILDGQSGAPAAAGSSGSSTNVVGVVDAGTFPVLRLELGGQWTDFELKASTNNFTNIVYYIKSSGTNEYADDTNVWVYFTDDYALDVRKWQKSAPAVAIGSQLASPTNSEVEYVLVLPSHECAMDWSAWMTATNARLVWSFVRYDGIGLEMNATGTKSHWNPVIPVEWRQERIAP